jgi:hypothetical protein
MNEQTPKEKMKIIDNIIIFCGGASLASLFITNTNHYILYLVIAGICLIIKGLRRINL